MEVEQLPALCAPRDRVRLDPSPIGPRGIVRQKSTAEHRAFSSTQVSVQKKDANLGHFIYLYVGHQPISTHDYGEMYNIALVFHESLHGYKNLYDPSLQRKLACTVEDNTDNITMFLRQFVVQTFSPLNVKPCTATSGRLSLCQQ